MMLATNIIVRFRSKLIVRFLSFPDRQEGIVWNLSGRSAVAAVYAAALVLIVAGFSFPAAVYSASLRGPWRITNVPSMRRSTPTFALT